MNGKKCRSTDRNAEKEQKVGTESNWLSVKFPFTSYLWSDKVELTVQVIP